MDTQTSSNLFTVFMKILRLLECPVCYEYACPPIYQCTNGHIICSKCKPQIPNCPTCRALLTQNSSRSRCVEDISDAMLFPCRNDGCEEILPLKEMGSHEQSCSYSNNYAVSQSKVDERRTAIYNNLLKHIEHQIVPFLPQKNSASIDEGIQTEVAVEDSFLPSVNSILSGFLNSHPDITKFVAGGDPSTNSSSDQDSGRDSVSSSVSAQESNSNLLPLLSLFSENKPASSPNEGFSASDLFSEFLKKNPPFNIHE